MKEVTKRRFKPVLWQETVFVPLPRLMLADRSLKPLCYQVALVLRSHAMQKKDKPPDSYVFPGNGMLEREVRRKSTQIIQAKHLLEEGGWIRVIRSNRRKTNRYYFGCPVIQSLNQLVEDFDVMNHPITFSDVTIEPGQEDLFKLFFEVLKDVKQEVKKRRKIDEKRWDIPKARKKLKLKSLQDEAISEVLDFVYELSQKMENSSDEEDFYDETG